MSSQRVDSSTHTSAHHGYAFLSWNKSSRFIFFFSFSMEYILLKSPLLPSFDVVLSEGLYFCLPNNWAVILSVKLRLPLSSPTRSFLS